jgi:hypothetical protein
MMPSFWSGVADWFEYSKYGPALAGAFIITFAIWNIWKDLKK